MIDNTTILAIMLVAAPALAQQTETKQTVTSPTIDREVDTFLNLLRSGKGNEAVTGLLGSSPLWTQKTGARESMLGQIDAATRAYGPVTGYEKLSTEKLGTMVVREYYLVQHRDMVVRWEFDIVRSAAGWHVGYFGFTDQPNSWF